MAIEFRCSQCNQLLRVPEEAAGKNARCPKCQALMTVPGVAVAMPLASEPSSPVSSLPPPTGNPFSSDPYGASVPLPPKPSGDNPFAGTTSAPADAMNPYASPAAAAAYYSQGQPGWGRPGLPWETNGMSFSTWWETTKLCMMQPSHAFSIMRQYGGMGQPMLHCAVGLSLGTVGQMLWYVPLMIAVTAFGAGGQAGGGEVAAMAGIQVVTQIISGVFTVALGATIGIMIAAAIGHVCLMIVGGATQGYETTLRVIGYAQGSTAWLNVIPGGALVAFVWMITMEIIGFSKAHETSIGKSALAVFLPMIVCCVGAIAIGVAIAIAVRSGAFR